MRNGKFSIALVASLLGVCATVMAQTGPVRPAYKYPSIPDDSSGPAGVRLGDSPLYAAPFVSAGIGHDSNVNLAPSNEIDSTYVVLSAGVDADARGPNSVFQMGLAATHGRYNDSSADDYTDAGLAASYDVALSSRTFVRLKLDGQLGHDPRGLTDRPVGDKPDKYRVWTPGIVFAYGAPSAQGRVEVFASRAARRYLNNRELTTGSERNIKDYGAAFYWRVMPKTQLLFEARGTDQHYTLPASDLSSRETRYYVGVTWEATAATSGTVKIGQLEKRFDSGRPTFKGTSWEGMITWKPRTYSSFDFYSSRQPLESTGLGNFILSDASGIAWNHDWSSVFSTAADARIQKDKYEGFNRDDDVTGLGIKAKYRFRRWMTVGAEYQYANRDSSVADRDFDKNVWLVTAEMSM